MIIDIEAVLRRLNSRGIVCNKAVDDVLAGYGAAAKVSRRILERAVRDRGRNHFLSFFAEALKWDKKLHIHMHRMMDHVLWGRKYDNLRWTERYDVVNEMCVAAVLAYVEEIDKP